MVGQQHPRSNRQYIFYLMFSQVVCWLKKGSGLTQELIISWRLLYETLLVHVVSRREDGLKLLENYCYTILNKSESKKSFLAAIHQLSFDFDRQQIQVRILARENNSHYFQEWLRWDTLFGNPQRILEALGFVKTSTSYNTVNYAACRTYRTIIPIAY